MDGMRTRLEAEYVQVEATAVVWAKSPSSQDSSRRSKIQPLRFIRPTRQGLGPQLGSGQEHRVRCIHSVWRSVEGTDPFYHFGLEDNDGTHFHLVFDVKRLTWWSQSAASV